MTARMFSLALAGLLALAVASAHAQAQSFVGFQSAVHNGTGTKFSLSFTGGLPTPPEAGFKWFLAASDPTPPDGFPWVGDSGGEYSTVWNTAFQTASRMDKVILLPPGGGGGTPSDVQRGCWEVGATTRTAPTNAGACTSVFGAGKPNSQGCTPYLTYTGTPSASSSAAFTITGNDVPANKVGILIYAYNDAATAFHGGTLYLQPPIKRCPPLNSGSSAPAPCAGQFDFDFNARIQSGIDPGLTAEKTVFAQYWYRDGGDAFGDGLSNALMFGILP